jgi:hypothetical protein
VRGRKLQIEHFLSQQVVDICPLIETFLKADQAFRLANFVCHRTDRPTAGGGTAILVRRGIVHHSVPVPGVTHLEATAIQVTMASKVGKPLAVYLSPSCPLIGADLTACFGGGLPVLMDGDLIAKHVDWNSRMTTRRETLLRDYADANSCLIFGPDTPNTNPYNTSVAPDVLNIVLTQKLSFPVYLTSCSALSLDHLPEVTDTVCCSSYITHGIALISGALTGPNSKLTWKTKFNSNRNCTTGWQLTRALRISPAPFWRLWQYVLPSFARVTTNGHRFRMVFRIRYA